MKERGGENFHPALCSGAGVRRRFLRGFAAPAIPAPGANIIDDDHPFQPIAFTTQDLLDQLDLNGINQSRPSYENKLKPFLTDQCGIFDPLNLPDSFSLHHHHYYLRR
jgi:hypothetical protein